MKDALAVEQAGAFAVVIEMVPSVIAQQVSEALTIPTIGIGAGPHTDGQILVWSDLAGLNTSRVPRFVKQYAALRTTLHDAVTEWRKDISEGVFPGPEHSFEEN
jgi:3-methyl-2-oxobutanoate hydroxymethyltransferase